MATPALPGTVIIRLSFPDCKSIHFHVIQWTVPGVYLSILGIGHLIMCSIKASSMNAQQ